MGEAVAPLQMDPNSWILVVPVVAAEQVEEKRDWRVLQPNKRELREELQRQVQQQVVPRHRREELPLQEVQQEQLPIDYCFGRELVPMPIDQPLQLQLVQELE